MYRTRGSTENTESKSSATHTSRISTLHINHLIEKLKNCKNRESTQKNYISIWKHFNKFVSRLDFIPPKWEQRTVLFCAHLIEKGIQSTTLKSYISAIKSVVIDDGSKCTIIFLKNYFSQIFCKNIPQNIFQKINIVTHVNWNK